MSKEGAFAIALGIGGIAMAIIQMIYPQIPAIVGWPVVAFLISLSIFFVIKGILIGRAAKKKNKDDDKSDSSDGWPRAW